MIICTKCKEPKPEAAFGKSKDKRNGFLSWCRKCSAKSSSAWQKRNLKEAYQQIREAKLRKPELYKASSRRGYLRRTYGLTEAQYSKMVEKQKGLCGICEKKSKRRLHVDHCHQTGIIRGLLCLQCNTALGKFQESPVVLSLAIIYLNTFSAEHKVPMKAKT